ncbi:thioredoxin family protein [Paenibacillus doosanensis]|uniref:Thioredoxin n=1 Tax=Paenibacillus konkukensis TaxID=2020716 RepID=A0ABY4RHI7_9BACL|nr:MULTISPECIES: thioredoxin family protein [Paenibacillus]MCS7461112.1 thioredoxin family protein [Paenibacillus doosanensis]UQZ81608.1 Thioredoxin [Paenibacillus konkukensis]
MEEWTEVQVRQWLEREEGRLFVYFFTPLCGTCKVTEKMLQVITAIRGNLPIVKCNANFCPELAQSWQIESVPCIVNVSGGGQRMQKKYRMQDVGELLVWFEASLQD